nr:immunoglobulin heavy chain junction region [Mus musculus]
CARFYYSNYGVDYW